MKLKTKMLTTLMSMTLALGVMIFAVFAAATQTLTITNTVSFVSQHVLSTVTGWVTGAEKGSFTDYTELTRGEGKTTTTADDDDGVLGTWVLGDNMQFAHQDEPIIITITIQNNSAERYFTFELAQTAYSSFNGSPLDLTNINRSVVYSCVSNSAIIANETYLDEAAIRVDAGTMLTVVITLSIADTGKSVFAFDNSFIITLRNLGTPSAGIEPVGGEDPNGAEGNEDPIQSSFVFDSDAKTIVIPQGKTLTYENLPNITVAGQPAFYGFYGLLNGGLYEQKTTLPCEAELTSKTLHLKFGPEPTNLSFSPIEGGTEYAVVKNAETAGAVEVPEMINNIFVTQLPMEAFRDCVALTSISIPNSMTSIADLAFRGCTGLTSVDLSQNLLSIGTSSFLYCTALTQITIPQSVTTIGSSAFFGCTSLANVVLQNGLLEIGEGAFYDCAALEDITIPQSVTIIGYCAFWDCISLASITIHGANIYIDDDAFYGCTNLKTVYLHSALVASRLSTIYDQGMLLFYFTTGSTLYILSTIGMIGSYVTNLSNFNAPVNQQVGDFNYNVFIKK